MIDYRLYWDKGIGTSEILVATYTSTSFIIDSLTFGLTYKFTI